MSEAKRYWNEGISKLKDVAARRFPGIYHFLRWRFGYPAWYRRVSEEVVARYGRRVISGPFTGMEYVDGAAGSAYIPKLLGCYEIEIHPWIELIIRSNYERIIDVGCAEGYYAVGLARSCPSTTVYGFDSDSQARALCAKLAEINNVADRVRVEGTCTLLELNKVCSFHSLLVCDVDGYEVDLLDPELVPMLRTIDILVELHEPLRPGSTRVIVARFQDSHGISLVDAVERRPCEYPGVSFLRRKDQFLALDETRPLGQQFAFLKAKSEGVHTEQRPLLW